MWFHKEPETPTLPASADVVWETLQSLTMLEKNRCAIEVLEDRLNRTRRNWTMSVIILGFGLLASTGMAGWSLYRLNQLSQVQQVSTHQPEVLNNGN